MTKPVLYMDFDGVLNFFGSKSSYRKRSGLSYHMKRNTPYGYTINWSAELVKKLNALNADWLWLTTWREKTALTLDPYMHVRSAGWLDFKDSDDDDDDSHPEKFTALLADQTANPRPFVWLDDTATRHFDASKLPVPVPYLLVVPDEATGLTLDDLNRVTDFLANL